MKQRLIALMLALTLFNASPVAAFAAPSEDGAETEEAVLTSEEEIVPLDISESAPEEAAEEIVEKTQAEGEAALDSASETDSLSKSEEEKETDTPAAGTEDVIEDDLEDAEEPMPLKAKGSYDNVTWTYDEKTGELVVKANKGSIGWSDSFENTESGDYPWKELPFSSLTIQNALSIGYDAFSYSKALVKISFPSTLTEIDACAFEGCENLTKVTIPDSVTTIGESVFYECSGLSEVTLPANLGYVVCDEKPTPIGDENSYGYDVISSCFAGCPLRTIKIANKNQYLTSSGDVLFSKNKTALVCYPGGSSKESYQIPDSVEWICADAFSGCQNLHMIYLGKNNKTYVGWGVFSPCTSLERFSVHPDNTEYSAPGGVLYSKDKKKLIAYPAGRGGNSYTTPASCNIVDYAAFGANPKLEEISLTEGVTELGYCFSGILGLKKLTLPATLASVDESVFGYTIYTGYNKILVPWLTDIYYTGTQEQWNAISGMADALKVFESGEKTPEIHYGSDPATPSTEADVTWAPDGADDSGDGGGDGDEDEDVSWSAAGELSDGTEITVSANVTGSVTFDGRKHVLSVNPAKNDAEVKATAAVNPDIVIDNFTVKVDGNKIEGITLKSCSYKNNTNPGEMQVMPAVNYGKDTEVTQLKKDHKDLDKVLNAMLKPSYKYDKDEEDYYWTYNPILITINQITLSEDTEVYNLKGMTATEKKELAKKDGVLVWSGNPGSPQKITFSTYVYREEEDWNDDGRPIKWSSTTYYIPTKATISGLYYQRVFNLGTDNKGNIKTAVKKITLKAGGWTIKSRMEDGEPYRWVVPGPKDFDYYPEEPDPYEGYEKNDKPESVSLNLNSSGMTGTKETKKWVRDPDEDGGGYWDYDEVEVTYANPGRFTGSLPSVLAGGDSEEDD
ncbi:MAG: leucine-rich repeat protein [Lachnospiraceae bacterium]|nr:leucine-rich repeat protein [Lachnospiraceae bacterium]